MVLLFASSRTNLFVSDGVTEDKREEGEIGKMLFLSLKSTLDYTSFICVKTKT